MIRFRFQLRPVAEIEPWRDAQGNPAPLHWFALTDGWYWIEVGEHELFRYVDEGESALPYADYQVARFWEDLLSLARRSIIPIPDALAERILQRDAWDVFLNHAHDWATQEGTDDEELARWALYRQALQRWWSRSLDSGHFTESPDIHLWRQKEQIHLDWKHKLLPERVFTAPYSGRVTVSVTSFLEALHDFNDQLMAQMAERVAGNAEIERDHKYRTTLLENALTHPIDENWEEIMEALRRLSREVENHHGETRDDQRSTNSDSAKPTES